MRLLVKVRPENGHYVARLEGEYRCQAEGITPRLATEKLQLEVQRMVDLGEVGFIDIAPPPRAEQSSAGLFRDDPTLREIVEEAYRYRDELKVAEFPE